MPIPSSSAGMLRKACGPHCPLVSGHLPSPEKPLSPLSCLMLTLVSMGSLEASLSQRMLPAGSVVTSMDSMVHFCLMQEDGSLWRPVMGLLTQTADLHLRTPSPHLALHPISGSGELRLSQMPSWPCGLPGANLNCALYTFPLHLSFFSLPASYEVFT